MMETHSKEASIDQILDLLCTAGYVDTTNSNAPPSQKVAAGLSWCIGALNANIIHYENSQCIEESLRSIGCPHTLQPSHIQALDTQPLFPVTQWLTSLLSSKQQLSLHEVRHAENTVEMDGHKTPMNTFGGNLDEMVGEMDEWNHRKMNAVKQLDQLRERINKNGVDSAVQKLITSMTSLKDLERQEDWFLLNRDSKHSELQAEIRELERKIESDSDSKSLIDGLHHSFSESLERVDLMKKQLAARLRDVMAVRRQIGDLPCQPEIVQYEHRLSELYAQIQGKHQQTRKYYSTYNALLEVKELMLKETSLLNSIISQFQEAFSSTDGRIKLVRSMEGIVRGSQQKLEKVQLGLQEEERNLNGLKNTYALAMGEQKRCYSLMKAFQEKCARNERLGGHSSK